MDPPSGVFESISVGSSNSCALDSIGNFTCWGGVSGDPPTPHASAIAPTGTFTTLDSGLDLTCGIKTDGTLECWGDDIHDRLNEPSGTFSRVAVGASHVCASHVCAINSDQSMVCWGETLFFDREGDGNPDDIEGHGNHTTTIPPRNVDPKGHSGRKTSTEVDDNPMSYRYQLGERIQVVELVCLIAP